MCTIMYLKCSDSSQFCTAWVKTKTFGFVWDKRVPSTETSNFWLLFMMSGTSAFTLLKLTIDKAMDCTEELTLFDEHWGKVYVVHAPK